MIYNHPQPLAHVTEDQFTAAMREAVAERGADWVYPKGETNWTHYSYTDEEDNCRYVLTDGTGPACVIGTALHKLGVPLEVLSKFEGRGVRGVVYELGLRDSFLEAALVGAQYKQDTGGSWGIALAEYESRLGLR